MQTFLDFARPPRLQRRRLDLAVVVERVYELVEAEHESKASHFKFQPADEPLRWTATRTNYSSLC